MARGGMRVGEVLKLTPADVIDRKLILNDTKSGKQQESIFIPQKVADRLKEYVRVQKIAPTQMIFPICYGAARAMVGKAGKLVGIRLRPHDLRRHAATFASRSNVALEIISKVILRHSSLQTTEIYLGKVSETTGARLDFNYDGYLLSLDSGGGSRRSGRGFGWRKICTKSCTKSAYFRIYEKAISVNY
jgi:integrase